MYMGCVVEGVWVGIDAEGKARRKMGLEWYGFRVDIGW